MKLTIRILEGIFNLIAITGGSIMVFAFHDMIGWAFIIVNVALFAFVWMITAMY